MLESGRQLIIDRKSENEPLRRSRYYGDKAAPRFLAVDFFCGAGGTARGLIDAGGYVIAGIDRNEQCEKTFLRNNANGHVDGLEPEFPKFLNLDIFPRTRQYPQGGQDKLLAELTALISICRTACPTVPLLFAICAPCQPFTSLSKNALTPECQTAWRRDSGLLGVAVKFVRRFEPELLLSENVAGIDRRRRYGDVWQEFQQELAELGYATGSRVVCASRFAFRSVEKDQSSWVFERTPPTSDGLKF